MIELRFEERRVSAGRESAEKVLQFRAKDVHVDSSTSVPIDPIWSEWKDVPVVQGWNKK